MCWKQKWNYSAKNENPKVRKKNCDKIPCESNRSVF